MARSTFDRVVEDAFDRAAIVAIEGGWPMADSFEGWFEAYPPHGRTMVEWADATGSELAYGPDVFAFEDEVI